MRNMGFLAKLMVRARAFFTFFGRMRERAFLAVSVTSLSAAPRCFSWGITALAVGLGGVMLPAAAQQRLFVLVCRSHLQYGVMRTGRRFSAR